MEFTANKYTIQSGRLTTGFAKGFKIGSSKYKEQFGPSMAPVILLFQRRSFVRNDHVDVRRWNVMWFDQAIGFQDNLATRQALCIWSSRTPIDPPPTLKSSRSFNVVRRPSLNSRQDKSRQTCVCLGILATNESGRKNMFRRANFNQFSLHSQSCFSVWERNQQISSLAFRNRNQILMKN